MDDEEDDEEQADDDPAADDLRELPLLALRVCGCAGTLGEEGVEEAVKGSELTDDADDDDVSELGSSRREEDALSVRSPSPSPSPSTGSRKNRCCFSSSTSSACTTSSSSSCTTVSSSLSLSLMSW